MQRSRGSAALAVAPKQLSTASAQVGRVQTAVRTPTPDVPRRPAGRRPSSGEARPNLLIANSRRQGAIGHDDALAGERLRVLLVASGSTLIESLRTNPAVDVMHSAAGAADALRLSSRHQIDLALIETDLPGFDGFELAWVLSQFARPPAIAFVADEPSRAVEAFDVGAVDFLVGPVRPERLAETLKRVHRIAPAATTHPRDEAAVPSSPEPTGVVGVGPVPDPSAVRWMEVRRDYVQVHTSTAAVLITTSLGVLVDTWAAAGIIRIHRSYAVQTGAISAVLKGPQGYRVVVDGRELPVSRRAAGRLKDRLLRGSTGS